ncbi:long-chain-fatty-acid--CoA ligase 5-like isoform X2 [Paramacrobiotus metropolitanus]|nr:long-chain-fatty-acid--CoA ligase 5-like isoform X2 [Paramacrobiotus metropolitanus]
MVLVPVYDTLGVDACGHIISQAEISVMVCDKNEQALTLLKLKEKAPVLRRIIIMDPPSEEVMAQSRKANVQVLLLEEVLKIGQDNLIPPKPAKPEEIATICYTSGTTGTPKGVMLTHYNVMAAVCATMKQISLKVGPQLGDSMCSFLPLSHMLERCCETAIYMEGGRVGFYSGDIRKINEDMQALKPTCVVVVPRLLNRIFSAVTGKVKGSWTKHALLTMGVWFKEWDLQNHIISRDTVWDQLMFKKVQEQLGGNLRFMVVGSAPLSQKVLRFCRVAFGCSIMEGYGQTEAVCPITLTIHGDVFPEITEGGAGHVGPPVPCCMVKLVDVPEMNLIVNRDGSGEICVKGATVFQGYYKEPGKTAEVLDADGWLHTGDIGLWTENGCLRVIDRKKHIFKLSQGEYIAPEKIESVYQKNQYVGQVFVHGDSLKSCLVGIVVPDEDALKRWAAAEGMKGDSFKDLCQSSKAKNMILKELTAEGKAASLHSFEQVKDILLLPEPFSVENDMLTPTLKTKRNEIRKSFAQKLSEMYTNLD